MKLNEKCKHCAWYRPAQKKLFGEGYSAPYCAQADELEDGEVGCVNNSDFVPVTKK